jgi:hypothetical protein
MSGRVPQSDDGSGTVLVLGLVGVAITFFVVTALAALLVAGHARARTAADLGALAGAAVAVENLRTTGLTDPCVAVADVALANGAQVTSCAVLPAGKVRVCVDVTLTGGLFSQTDTQVKSSQVGVGDAGWMTLSATALAGPVPAEDVSHGLG